MARKRVGPKCPGCGQDSLYCYGVIRKKLHILQRYLFCSVCHLRILREYGENEFWVGRVKAQENTPRRLQLACN